MSAIAPHLFCLTVPRALGLTKGDQLGSELTALTDLLKRYISSVNANAVVSRALRENNLSSTNPSRSDIRRCRTSLRKGIELFVPTALREQALHELERLCGRDSNRPDPCSFTVESEADIAKARAFARRVCEEAGASPFAMQKVTTIVSELTRNIVQYAQRGTIDLVPSSGASKRIVIRAVDRGPGIANIDLVLSGHYESKTGLGRGLSGTKRLADRFDISTGSAGTNVVVEVAL